ncbi:peroxide stress protein YaaA [Candidatus Mycosynbacter amalyticus]|uniref:UPF0246 protein GII36_02065 n=1 Tax=Candidatus Mycosynbacter amalyticus TaxID=2665156 RepID=A0A857MLG5_9BACT|nr:YaaA family protein [Candidatus Mycosynbacter amalyticus]QHN42635.1 peroxide stress protein YaaA [Candidatus Mycosynbacter amalyticus]
MLQILLHSSKTMRSAPPAPLPYQAPRLLHETLGLAGYLASLNTDEIAKAMKLSPKKAADTHELLATWSSDPGVTRPAVDAFIGDIYSGLQVASLSDADRMYANEHLLILSGLYGGLRALDSVTPYRLEMGYRLPNERYRNLYEYWGDRIATLLHPQVTAIINLSAVEYTKALLPYASQPVVTPKFLTISPKTGESTFVVVHAKIARGAFARWMIVNRVEDVARLQEFSDLGYVYDDRLSSSEEPVFVCREFGGLGLSVRLT